MELDYVKVPKALQKDVEFFGLRAKYVERALKGIVVIIVVGLFLSTKISGIIALLGSLAGCAIYISLMMYYSRAYGENGFLKKQVDARMPEQISGHVNKESLIIWKGK